MCVFNKWKWVFQQKTPELMDNISRLLQESSGFRRVYDGGMYIYAEGTIPIMVCAHVDTVHKHSPDTVLWDPEEQLVWSPTGIGGDDRAGVSAILELLERGHRPHVLFLDEEETGGKGAKEAVKELTPPDVLYIIELDRKNATEAVFYQLDNKEFEKYIEGFGFKHAYGSFSDISVLCPAWKMAGVNLSCGYYNAHTSGEFVDFRAWANTVARVEEMLVSPPAKQFAYKALVYSYARYRSAYWDEDYYGWGDGGYNWKQVDGVWARFNAKGEPAPLPGKANNVSYLNNKGDKKDNKENDKKDDTKDTTAVIPTCKESPIYSEIWCVITPADVYELMGFGTLDFWKEWLKTNREEIEESAEQIITEEIQLKALEDSVVLNHMVEQEGINPDEAEEYLQITMESEVN